MGIYRPVNWLYVITIRTPPLVGFPKGSFVLLSSWDFENKINIYSKYLKNVLVFKCFLLQKDL